MPIRFCWRLLFVALFLLVLRSAPIAAQPSDSAAVRAAFDSIVTAHTYTATLENGRLTGPGADWLEARGRAVDHFLMSERHGTAQIPVVAATLYERMADHYGPVALEIGPYAAEATNEALGRDGYSGLKELVTRYEGPVIPFLNWKEESQMAARMAEAGGTIWGIDYEFLFSLPMHLDALAERAETDRERAAVRRIRTRLEEEWGGATAPALGVAAPSALRALRTAFEPRGDDEALSRIDALLESNAIYAPYVRDSTDITFFDSRTRRETLMKEQLIEQIRDWEDEHGAAPNVFHKNAHTSKRPEERFYISLGAFMAEWARVRDEETFHVLADCNGGSIPKTGQGGGGACTAYLGGEDSPFADHLRDDKITILDMRALRSRYFDWDFLPDDLREEIVSVDAYAALPEVDPSEPLNPLPREE